MNKIYLKTECIYKLRYHFSYLFIVIFKSILRDPLIHAMCNV